MAERLHRFEVPEGEQTVRIVFPDGRTFRLGVRDEGGVRFVVEGTASVKMIEFYGRGGNAIVGLKIDQEPDAGTETQPVDERDEP